jgi:hypothetical protein
MAPTQTIDYPCPTCNSPMGLVRVSPLDRQYDLHFFKCEVCKCEVCSHMEPVASQRNREEPRRNRHDIRGYRKTPPG